MLGVGVAVLLIIILPVSWIGFLVIAVLLAAYQWWLYRLKQTIPAPDGATSTSSSTPPDDQPPQVSQPGPAQAV